MLVTKFILPFMKSRSASGGDGVDGKAGGAVDAAVEKRREERREKRRMKNFR